MMKRGAIWDAPGILIAGGRAATTDPARGQIAFREMRQAPEGYCCETTSWKETNEMRDFGFHFHRGGRRNLPLSSSKRCPTDTYFAVVINTIKPVINATAYDRCSMPTRRSASAKKASHMGKAVNIPVTMPVIFSSVKTLSPYSV